MNTNRVLSGDMLILIAMAVFGSSSLFFRLNPTIPVPLFLLAFQIVGAICFFALTMWQGFPTLTKRDYLLLVALAGAALLNDLCYFYAFRFTTVANAAMGHQSVSIFLLVLSPYFLKERTMGSEWIALVIAVIGVVILYGGNLGDVGTQHLLGITLAVLSGLFYAIIIVLYRVIPDGNRGLTIRTVNFWRYSISSILILPFLSFVEIGPVGRRELLTLLLFGVLFAVIASGIHNRGLHTTRSLHASILGKTEPIFAIIYAALLLEEIPSPREIVGGALIIVPSLWLMVYGKKEQS